MKEYGLRLQVRFSEFEADTAWIVVLAVSEREALRRGHSFISPNARIDMVKEWKHEDHA